MGSEFLSWVSYIFNYKAPFLLEEDVVFFAAGFSVACNSLCDSHDSFLNGLAMVLGVWGLVGPS